MRAPNFYASPGFERAGERRRDTDWIIHRLTHSESVFLPLWRNQNLILDADGAPRAALLDTGGITAVLGAGVADGKRLEQGEIVFLGVHAERAHFALDLSADEAPLDRLRAPGLCLPSGAGRGPDKTDPGEAALHFADLRRVGALLDRREGALLAFARAMLFWHSRHRFCGVCGSPTRSEEAGHMRRCTAPGCATMHFPRTDPAVIMLVTNGDRALLGRNKNFPLPGMYSTLAGFVEPGESLEDAVAREVREETGIVIGPVLYHSSQPWPFPANIMLGFTARALSTEITVDPGELADARWFSRDYLSVHADDDEFRLPRRDSIARRLIEDWLTGAIPS